MDASMIRMLGVTLSPLFIFLFACEMSNLEDSCRWLLRKRPPGPNKGWTDALTAFAVLKLPLSVLLLILAPDPVPVIAFVPIVVIDLYSIVCIVLDQRKITKARKEQNNVRKDIFL